MGEFGTRYAWTYRKMHCLLGNLLLSAPTRNWTCFNFPFVFSLSFSQHSSDTFDQITYIFNGRSRSRRRNNTKRHDFSPHCHSDRLEQRVLSASLPKTRSKTKKKKRTKINWVPFRSRRFCSAFFCLSSPSASIRSLRRDSQHNPTWPKLCVCDRLLIKLNNEAYTFLDNSVEMSICFDSVVRITREKKKNAIHRKRRHYAKEASLISLGTSGISIRSPRTQTSNAFLAAAGALNATCAKDKWKRTHTRTARTPRRWPKANSEIDTNKSTDKIRINANALGQKRIHVAKYHFVDLVYNSRRNTNASSKNISIRLVYASAYVLLLCSKFSHRRRTRAFVCVNAFFSPLRV